MTKKDFQLIADTLNSLVHDEAHCFDSEEDCHAIVARFTGSLMRTNARFNSKTFMDACFKGTKWEEPSEALKEAVMLHE